MYNYRDNKVYKYKGEQVLIVMYKYEGEAIYFSPPIDNNRLNTPASEDVKEKESEDVGSHSQHSSCFHHQQIKSG